MREWAASHIAKWRGACKWGSIRGGGGNTSQPRRERAATWGPKVVHQSKTRTKVKSANGSLGMMRATEKVTKRVLNCSHCGYVGS